MSDYQDVVLKISEALVYAGSTFRNDKKRAYQRAIEKEQNERAKFILETTLQNAETAEKMKSPLCDDTGIPHVVIEVGKNKSIEGAFLEAVKEGIKEGLRKLPGRPMGILGKDKERIDQSGGISPDSAGVEAAPFLIRTIEEDVIKVHVLLFGGGPAIRGKTHRVFHQHNIDVVIDEIVEWAKESVSQLGCAPCTLAIGIGRSHFEATSLALEAQVEGNYDVQSDLEKEITKRVNESDIGPLGLRGDTSVIGTFLKVGPQRSSGIRVVSIRPNCSIEPRIATVEF